jgi:uncharacterized protein YfbU (UPF0304 family)
MYQIFVKNLKGFEKLFQDDERINIAMPLYLLTNIEKFKSHKSRNTKEYQNLIQIIKKAYELKSSTKYHNFGMFLTELGLQYFDFNEPILSEQKIDEEMLDYQVSLLHQFMFPAYYS